MIKFNKTHFPSFLVSCLELWFCSQSYGFEILVHWQTAVRNNAHQVNTYFSQLPPMGMFYNIQFNITSRILTSTIKYRKLALPWRYFIGMPIVLDLATIIFLYFSNFAISRVILQWNYVTCHDLGLSCISL